MIDLQNVRSQRHTLRTRVLRGVAVGSLLAWGLMNASGVGQALASPSGSYTIPLPTSQSMSADKVDNPTPGPQPTATPA